MLDSFENFIIPVIPTNLMLQFVKVTGSFSYNRNNCFVTKKLYRKNWEILNYLMIDDGIECIFYIIV